MLEVCDLAKTYEGQPLLKGISFSVAAGETICLLGASGSGKSTLLRIIAGLEQAEEGLVRWSGQDISSLPVHQRHFGLMFQDYALFPHRDVFANVAFGLRMSSRPSSEIRQRVKDVLAQVNLSGFENRRVTELSGGEQQRVAMARTLAPRPHLLMLDEPLGALDRALRERLMDELRGILRNSGIPTIYVTHDQEEAFSLADRVLLLYEGQIVQAGTPAEVFTKPASAWVAHFLGLGNVLNGQVSVQGMETPFGRLHPACEHHHAPGENVTLLLRPAAEVSENGEISGEVSDVTFRGQTFRVELEHALYFNLDAPPKPGARVRLHVLQVQCLGSV